MVNDQASPSAGAGNSANAEGDRTFDEAPHVRCVASGSFDIIDFSIFR